MTNSKEVTRLRKEGKLEEAYTMATEGLLENPNDEWMKRAMSWCLYDALKCNASFEQSGLFLTRLSELKDLDMSVDEEMLWKNMVWPIQAFVRSCSQQNRLPNDVLSEASSDSKAFYQAHCDEAEALLYTQFEEKPVLVTHVNEQKHFVSFLTANRKEGFFSYGRLLKKTPKIGEVLLCRFQNVEQGKPSIVLTCRPESDMTPYQGIFFKDFEGPVKMSATGFGFVNNIFIPAGMLNGKANGDLIKGTAMLKFDKKKGVWGWTA